MKQKIAIIGGGINGLTLAEAFNSVGFEVTVYDQTSVPNPNGPSMLENQILRPQYVDQQGLSDRIQPALAAWRALFQKLGENYFCPEGVIAISSEEGDWADRSLNLMRSKNLPFRYVHQSVLKDLIPGIKLNQARFGVLADWGGQIRGRDLMFALSDYLREKGVAFRENTIVREIDEDHGVVKYDGGKDQVDWVIVTGGHMNLVPRMREELKTYLGTLADYQIPFQKQNWWRYAPIWVDLGAYSNCWGIPRPLDHVLRIGAGSLSENIEDSDEVVLEKLQSTYADIIIDFEQYELLSCQRVPYIGYPSGEFALNRFGQMISLIADSGHGFKFAADNARAIVKALQNDRLSFAAREIAGV